MRILKHKIALARASALKKNKAPSQDFDYEFDFGTETSSIPLSPEIKQVLNEEKPKRRSRASNTKTTSTSKATKNIVKNFGKAICSFASSDLAVPYLNGLVEKEGIKVQTFISYVLDMKNKIDGLFHFRSLLLLEVNDNEKTIKCKRVFKAISEIFIKYFSVNWIFHSRVFHKSAHLQFRYKMLRRIQCPELFTYLKSSKKKGISL